jgi:hypothetical protein
MERAACPARDAVVSFHPSDHRCPPFQRFAGMRLWRRNAVTYYIAGIRFFAKEAKNNFLLMGIMGVMGAMGIMGGG